jgi:membrane protease YdiL (CAAX protease family)
MRWWDGRCWTVAVAQASGGVQGPGAARAAWAPAGTAPQARTAPGSEIPAPNRVIPARAAWWALLGLALGEIVGSIFAEVAAVFTGSDTGAVATLAGEIGLWAGMFGAVVYVSRRFGTGSLARDYTFGFRRVDLAWGPLIAFTGLVVEGVLGQAFAGSKLAGTNTQLITGQKGNTVGFAIITVIVSVGAPFFEELFFRGLLRTALRSAIGPTWAAIAQGCLFGLAHVNPTTGLGNVEVVAIIGSLGIILGLFANFTGRLAAGMIGHSLFNLLATISVLAS